VLVLAVLLLTYWAVGSVRALRGPGWRSTVRWLLAILVASTLMGWSGSR
jgi:hypothetical protein